MIRTRSFKKGVIVIALLTLVMTVVAGATRSPMADRWVGDVYILDAGRQNPRKVDVTLTLEIKASGRVRDKQMRELGKYARWTFDGKDKGLLKSHGFSAGEFFSRDGRKRNEGLCLIPGAEMKTLRNHFPRQLGGNYELVSLLTTSKHGTSVGNPCHNFFLGFRSFDEMDFMGGKDARVVAVMRRDSHANILERLIMKARFGSWVNNPNLNFM